MPSFENETSLLPSLLCFVSEFFQARQEVSERPDSMVSLSLCHLVQFSSLKCKSLRSPCFISDKSGSDCGDL